jgi:hypothetical protein
VPQSPSGLPHLIIVQLRALFGLREAGQPIAHLRPGR